MPTPAPVVVFILLVEDEAAHVEAIRRAFRGLNAEIRVASTLQEYRRFVTVWTPDIAIVDLNLPDGRALEALTAPPEDGRFPIVVMTSYGDQVVAVEAMKAGALDYFVKSPETLMSVPHVVERALREWALLQERKRSVADLASSEERYRLLFERNLSGLYRSTLDGRILDCNESFARIFGYASCEEALTHPAADLYFFGAEDRKRFLAALQATGTVLDFESQGRRTDGSPIWLSERASLVPGGFRGRQDIEGALTDITERKRAQDQVARLDAEMRLILESAGEGIIGLNLQGAHTFVNPSAARLVGYAAEELVGGLSHETWHGMHRDGTCPIYATFRDGTAHTGQESLWRKDGTVFPARFTCTPIRQQGRLTGAVVTFTDITQELQTQKDLTRALKLEQLGHLVAGLAHEVRNPLQGIAAGCAALGLEPLSDDGRALLDSIEEQGDRISRLTKELVDLGKPLNADARQKISLLAVLEDLAGSWGEHPLAAAHPLVLRDRGSTATLQVERLSLRRALVQLLENAAQHAPAGEAIGLRASHDNGTVVLHVEDRGPGIPAEYLARAFDPFFTRTKGGTGLGLSFVRHVLESHGGAVSLANREPGPGLCATITLPAG